MRYLRVNWVFVCVPHRTDSRMQASFIGDMASLQTSEPEIAATDEKHGSISKLLHKRREQIVVVCFAAVIFFGCIISPPSLMDDVDAVQAQISRNMIKSGDWVTPRLDGVVYMEKAPLKYWTIAVSFLIFGVHDWAARIPVALAAVLLCWLTCRFGEWAFGKKAGMYAGLCLATCVGLFLFTRILIPDVMLTLAITAAMYAMVRLVEDRRSWKWPMLFWASLAVGVLLKGLIGVVFPIGITFFYMLATRRLRDFGVWLRFRPLPGVLLFLVIAAPWHVLAMIQNPPLVDFTMHSERGSYHGFFWFYFINEQVLRFLNRRYPRDYDTVPRLAFWVFHLVWLFPWSVYLPSLFRLDYRSEDRPSRVRLLALCWIGVVLIFFTFSTTQEYYSLPCYPAFALLLGSALASEKRSLKFSSRAAALVCTLCFVAIVAILFMVRGVPAPGDIADALTQHPKAYTLSLGHMEDLTLDSFAYLRLPLIVAGIAFAVGAIAAWGASKTRAIVGLAVMMVLFFHAARLALVVFDPYLSSRPLAEALKNSPKGQLIDDNPYWEFSSVFFYADTTGLILNGRRNNLVYGSYAPEAPPVFIEDSDFIRLWTGAERCYVVSDGPKVQHLKDLVGESALHLVKESGNKYLFSNQ